MTDARSEKERQKGLQNHIGQDDRTGAEQRFLRKVYEKIAEAEAQLAQGCYLEDAEAALVNLRNKYLTQQKPEKRM